VDEVGDTPQNLYGFPESWSFVFSSAEAPKHTHHRNICSLRNMSFDMNLAQARDLYVLMRICHFRFAMQLHKCSGKGTEIEVAL
jgi:hypothetical protein